MTVDGNKVPYTPVPEGSGPQVQSGSFTLNADGTVTHATNFGQVDGKELSHDSNGTYTLDGSRLSFQWKDGGTTTATLVVSVPIKPNVCWFADDPFNATTSHILC